MCPWAPSWVPFAPKPTTSCLLPPHMAAASPEIQEHGGRRQEGPCSLVPLSPSQKPTQFESPQPVVPSQSPLPAGFSIRPGESAQSRGPSQWGPGYTSSTGT